MATWYVKAGAKGGDGSEAAPFGTLAAAAQVAAAGDEVIVGAGEYRERLQATNRITWRGAGPGQSIIDGGWNGAKTENGDPGPTLVAIGGGATVDGFTIYNSPGDGVVMGSDSGPVLRNCQVDYCQNSGIIITSDAGAAAVGATVEGCTVTRTCMRYKVQGRLGGAGIGIIKSNHVVVRGCTVANGYGEGIDIGRGSADCLVEGCTVFDHDHLALYFNRCTRCVARGNVLFLTGNLEFLGANKAWPAGVVFGNEGSVGMKKYPPLSANQFIDNLVVNFGTLLDVRNNAANYDTVLDKDTVIAGNTFVAGPCTRLGLHIQANEHGNEHGLAQVHNNVVYVGGDVDALRGGQGLAYRANAWTVAPPSYARDGANVVGFTLVNPGAALASLWPGLGHNLERDNYRPPVGSALVGAGVGGATIGALEPVDDEPEEPPTEPPSPSPDWPALLAQLDAATEQLAVAGMARDAAESALTALRALLNEYQENGG